MRQMNAAQGGDCLGCTHKSCHRQQKDSGDVLRDRAEPGNGFHLAGSNVELGATAQSTDQQLRLHTAGISDEDVDGE